MDEDGKQIQMTHKKKINSVLDILNLNYKQTLNWPLDKGLSCVPFKHYVILNSTVYAPCRPEKKCQILSQLSNLQFKHFYCT